MCSVRWSYRILVGVSLAVVACSFLASAGWADRDDEKKEKGKGKGKAEIVEIDLDKLPPGLAKELRAYLKGDQGQRGQKGDQDERKDERKGKGEKKKGEEKKGKGKGEMTLTLTDAIKIAEKQAKGEAIKAERRSKDGVVTFRVDVLVGGEKTRVELDTRGKEIEAPKKKKEKD